MIDVYTNNTETGILEDLYANDMFSFGRVETLRKAYDKNAK